MRDKKQTLLEPEIPAPRLALDRREFMKLIGGGIFIFFSTGDLQLLNAQGQRREYPTDFNAYLRIDESGRVTVFSGKIEMGQGVMTSLAQMAAEELGVSLESIEMVMGDTQLCPWDMGTFGSMSTRFFGPVLRGAAAEAKAVLLELASEQLKAPKEALHVDNGVVFLASDKDTRVTFGQLAKGKKIERRLTGKPPLRSISQFTLSGKSVRRLDALAKVTGEAKFAGDMRMPGMLYARIVRPPAHGATLKSVDTSAAEKIPGVTVINQDGLIAVLHADLEEAARALVAVKADFEISVSTVDTDTIFDHLLQVAPPPQERERKGELAEGEKASAALFEHRYENGYGAHAPMETHTALASVEGGKATVWTSTQTPFPNQQQIAQALGFPLENVRVITPYVGGGFGGKSSAGLQAVEAARLSKFSGKPVQVTWTRAEEFFYDTFRPAAVVKIKSGVDSAGRISLWDYHVYFAGARSSEQFYDVPHNLIRAYGQWGRDTTRAHPFATGPWRAPGANINVFARESQIDIMAAKAKTDPLEFRLNNTSDKRMRSVLEAAAEKFGWKKAAIPSGRGFGIACGIDAGTYIALIAEVKVDKTAGSIQVKRIVCAQDMGQVINPDGAKMQMEGCITMGLGYALSEIVRFKGGEVMDRNFNTYELPRFSWLPEIECVLVKNDELTPQGGGEPAIIGVGAAIANAIFDATGARLFQMPMTPEQVKKALM
ncbi:MAG: molybdopterin-dependent oxidoreductase [Acidobacteria bacterium]|nr:molybdopterin-dependent oxidoreductase [Acidobacteriota bacterium]MCL5288104.1 molybdopterin-dependent oxidoreductase [Acidobacteriota bacterium]